MSDIETLYEAVLNNIKETLIETGLFKRVDEGETQAYDPEPVDLAQVIPGEALQTVSSATSMRHSFQIWVTFLTTDPEKTLAQMRTLGYTMYTLLFQDYTRGGTAWRFFPQKFESGYVAYNNEMVVGVQTRWEAVLFQNIPEPE